MAEINSQIYNTIEGELVTSRSDDGSILSISSSTIKATDEHQFVELDSMLFYYSSPYLDDIMDTEFKELVPPQDLIDAQQSIIPPGMILISQSDWLATESLVLNLHEDLIVSKSYFDNEIYILKAENTSLDSIVKYVDQAASTILDKQIVKYSDPFSKHFPNNLSPENEKSFNEFWVVLNATRAVFDIPFSSIIESRVPIASRTSSYVDYTYEVVASMSAQNGIKPYVSKIITHETDVNYKTAYSDKYLFDSFYYGAYIFENPDTVTALLGERQYLLNVTKSLREEITRLHVILSGGGGGEGITVIPSIVTINENQEINCTLKYGALPYRIDNAPESEIAIASINGETLVIKGIKEGNTHLLIKDATVKNFATVGIIVSNKEVYFDENQFAKMSLTFVDYSGKFDVSDLGVTISHVTFPSGKYTWTHKPIWTPEQAEWKYIQEAKIPPGYIKIDFSKNIDPNDVEEIWYNENGPTFPYEDRKYVDVKLINNLNVANIDEKILYFGPPGNVSSNKQINITFRHYVENINTGNLILILKQDINSSWWWRYDDVTITVRSRLHPEKFNKQIRPPLYSQSDRSNEIQFTEVPPGLIDIIFSEELKPINVTKLEWYQDLFYYQPIDLPIPIIPFTTLTVEHLTNADSQLSISFKGDY